MYKVYKKGLSIFLVLLMVMGVMTGVVAPNGGTAHAAGGFDGGTGSASIPYRIATADQLNEVRNHLATGIYFELTADIDLSSYASSEGWTPIGDISEPFKGYLDGNGFKITNLKINRELENDIGLIGVNGGSITNVILEVIEVKGNSSVGGLVGYNDSGTILNSHETGSVSGSDSVSDSSRRVGGLVGYNDPGTISNSYATGSVTGTIGVGGLVGWNHDGIISASYSTGSVTGTNEVGGLVGINITANIFSSFYDSDTTGQKDTGKGTGKTTLEMQDLITFLFNGWNFNFDWYILPGHYPELWMFVAMTPGTNVGTTKLTGVSSEMEYMVNTGSYTTIVDTSVDNIVVGVGDKIYLRVKGAFPPGFNENIRSVAVQNINIVVPMTTGEITEVTAPVAGATPVATIAETEAYTASIEWSPGDAIFAGEKIYTATITLKPKPGYTLTGVPANSFSVDGATTKNDPDSGVVTAEFPATAAIPISAGAIAGVTAPVVGATPVNTISDNAQYSASITWLPVEASFKGEKIYKAMITLRPKPGYTLTGVPANSFTVAGATTKNDVNSGVVTAEFPATAAVSIATGAITGVIAPVAGSKPVTTVTYSAEYSATLTWLPTTTLFVGATSYTALIIITPRAGHTLTGVPANFFTIAGATTTNAANSGVVIAEFPATQPVSTGTGSTFTAPSNTIVTSANGTLTLPLNQSGEVNFEDAVKISIPVGAIDKELKLTIEKVLEPQKLFPNNEVLLSPVYEILKNFPENFSKPVTLNLSFDPTLVKSNQKAAVFYYDEVKKAWVEVAGSKIQENHIRVEVNQLGKYAVLSVNEATGIPVTEQVTDTSTIVNLHDFTGHWAEVSIKQALSMGMIKGYQDGTFQPNRTVTRAEFAVMLMNVLKPQGIGVNLTFTDTAAIGAWAQVAIAQAVQAGIITGYSDGGFHPNAEITRAEMAVILAKALGEPTNANMITNFADDKDIPAWAKGSVDFVKQSGIVQGKGKNEFAPQEHATRAEAVTVLLKLWEQLKLN